MLSCLRPYPQRGEVQRHGRRGDYHQRDRGRLHRHIGSRHVHFVERQVPHTGVTGPTHKGLSRPLDLDLFISVRC